MTTTTTRMEEYLIRLNGQAMSLLWEGNEGEAMRLLRHGLAMAQQHHQQSQCQNHEGSSTTTASGEDDDDNGQRLMILESLDLIDVTERTTNRKYLVQQGLRFSRHIMVAQQQAAHHTCNDKTSLLQEEEEEEAEAFIREALNNMTRMMHCNGGSDKENHNTQMMDDDEEEQNEESPVKNIILPLTVDYLFAVMALNMAVIHHENGLSRGIRSALNIARHCYQAALQTLLPFLSSTENNINAGDLQCFVKLLWTQLGHVAAVLDDALLLGLCHGHLAKMQHDDCHINEDNSNNKSTTSSDNITSMMQEAVRLAPAA